MNYLIIGNSISATSAVEAIREKDRQNTITIISDEPYANYSRPLISYLLGKNITLAEMLFKTKDFYQNNKVKLLLNKKVNNLDLKKRAAILSNGRRIRFDQLLLALGGRPVVPEIPGRGLSGVFTFTKLADALKIKQYIQANKVKQAVIIGAGLIGLKAAEALLAIGIKVTIVELADRILSATFDQKASSIIERALKKTGCNLITNNTVTRIKAKGKKVNAVILKDKKIIPARLVILAIGVSPNIELVKGTPIKTNKGILVDKFMQTNIKGIYAAGDCSEAKDALLNIHRPLALWPVAARQGKIAGYNMSAEKKEYTGSFAMNSVELCAIATISVGETLPENDCQVLEYIAPDKSIYKKIVLKDNKIRGVIFVGDIERAGIYTGLIKDKVDVAAFKEHLLTQEFGLVNLPREYRKHLVSAELAII